MKYIQNIRIENYHIYNHYNAKHQKSQVNWALNDPPFYWFFCQKSAKNFKQTNFSANFGANGMEQTGSKPRLEQTPANLT